MLTWLRNYWRLQPRTPKQGQGKNRGRAKMPYQPRAELLEDRCLLSGGFQQFGGFSSGYPLDITTGPDGALWFTDVFNGREIGRITTDGTITEFTVPVNSGYGIAAGSDGNLWFPDSARTEMWRLTPDGEFTAFPVSGYPIYPTAGPNGNVWFGEYIVDHFVVSAKIGEIAPDGSVTEFDLPLTGSPQNISGIAAGPDGNIWVTARDASGNEIERITPTGTITAFSCATTPLKGPQAPCYPRK
jgi:streptogramin lyase